VDPRHGTQSPPLSQIGCGCISKPAGQPAWRGSFSWEQGWVSEVGVEAVAVTLVGFARNDIEERRDHLLWLEEAGRGLRGSLCASHRPDVLPPAPGLTMLIIRPVSSTSLAEQQPRWVRPLVPGALILTSFLV